MSKDFLWFQEKKSSFHEFLLSSQSCQVSRNQLQRLRGIHRVLICIWWKSQMCLPSLNGVSILNRVRKTSLISSSYNNFAPFRKSIRINWGSNVLAFLSLFAFYLFQVSFPFSPLILMNIAPSLSLFTFLFLSLPPGHFSPSLSLVFSFFHTLLRRSFFPLSFPS